MSSWLKVFKYDPIKPLLESDNEAIVYFTNRDVLNLPVKPTKILWQLKLPQQILHKQQDDGSWEYPGGNKKIRSSENYNQIETFRNLGYLVEMYGFNKASPAIAKAADYMFSFQTEAGDIRGILGNQYTPYYTAGILELMIKSGYADDPRVTKAFQWLNSIRQNDGGWVIPLRTLDKKLDIIAMKAETLEPDRAKPYSHLVTGVVLRAYAAHKVYRKSPEAISAGNLLMTSLFNKDSYPDRNSAEFWLKFSYPFWFTDLISALDSLSILGFTTQDTQIVRAIRWFVDNQDSSGLWKLHILRNQKKFDSDLYISLAILRIIKRLDDSKNSEFYQIS